MALNLLRGVFLICLWASALEAGDLFIGHWKLNLAKSKLTGQIIEISEAPGGGYAFKEDEHIDIILADGLDHATHFGDTMAITQKTPDTWAIVYKRADRVVMNTVWTVSPDNQTLTYAAKGTRPNGQRFSNQMIARRNSGTSGLIGKWETSGVTLSSPREIYIEPYQSGGHVITFPGRQQTIRMKFDGKEYPEAGPTVADGSTSSGRRLDDRTIETTEKVKGRIVEIAKASVSENGATQTIVITEPNDKTPVVLVYDREAK